jgi:hypothetical protein
LKNLREKEKAQNLYNENIKKLKTKIILRIKDSNLRFEGIAFRQALQFTRTEIEKEQIMINKKRGILRRIMDSSVRLESQGYNQLIKDAGVNKNNLKNKLRVIIKSLKDSEVSYMICAYNGLKENAFDQISKQKGRAYMKKVQMVKSLVNKGYALQKMALNSLNSFLKSQRLNNNISSLKNYIKELEQNLEELTHSKQN